MGDMNAKAGNECTAGVAGSFGVFGVDRYGECLINMCSKGYDSWSCFWSQRQKHTSCTVCSD